MGDDGAKRKRGSKFHVGVDTIGRLLAAHVIPATADNSAEVGRLPQAATTATGDSVGIVYVD